MYDLIIIGGGPAAAAGAVYAARKQLKSLLVTAEFGGQSTVSETIYNWIGTPEISGRQLGEDLKKHVMYYKGPFLDVVEGEKVVSVVKNDKGVTIKTEGGKEFSSLSLLVASGSGRRKLEAINADVYENKGITYCASCDGPLFSGMDVIVIGGGNAGFESAAQLLAYCKSVTLINRSETFRADAITVEKVKAHPNMKIIINAVTLRVDGEQFVNSLTYKDTNTGEEHKIEAGGIFVETGQIPNTGFLKDVIPLDEIGKIIVDPTNQATPIPGIWAAGDATNGKYHQNNIACGDAVKALEDIYIWLHKNK
ncbi:MAG: FAD-dependent oxidoreductase [Candidatus Nomurabacteria bacterium]|nr:FAD-dependent oxidoreductase [Candidatus Nomurabacteria bacterium]